MKRRDFFDLFLLAALWGGSFLFMRIAAPEFGPIALVELRVGVAAVFLVVVMSLRCNVVVLRQYVVPVTVVGLINSAVPFCLLAYATLSITAGFASILNATTPMWGAIVAWLWLRDRLTFWRVVGLVVGFAGIVVLTWDKASFKADNSGLAILAGLTATLFYGLAASYTKKQLTGVDPLAIATGSQIGAAIVLLPLALLTWPTHQVSSAAWLSVLVMGVASTGVAYILFFRLIANVGPARAITVTFLVPIFAVLWGAVALDEKLTVQMFLGGIIVLAGTALSTGAIKPQFRVTIPDKLQSIENNK